jgi:phage virion morphogenesis protein
MSGVGIQILDEGFDQAIQAIEGVETLDQGELLDAIGRLLQESTRERIEVTKTSPDGASWKPNRAGTSTLYQSGNLAASIDYRTGSGSVEIGSGLVYAAIHHFGGTIKPVNAKRLAFMAGNQLVFAMKVDIPARPYLGISSQDQTEIFEMIVDTIAAASGGTLQ